MPRRGGRHYVLVKGAEEALDAFKYEVAVDLGLKPISSNPLDPNSDGPNSDGSLNRDWFKNLTTQQVGLIRGTMVRRIQAAGEWAILQRYKNNQRPLMPPEALPPDQQIRDVTNTGNPARDTSVTDTPNSGQLITSVPRPEPSEVYTTEQQELQ